MEDSVAKRLLNIENALERIEKSQDDQKESMETQAALDLQLSSAKLQNAAAKSQMTHEDLALEQFKYALSETKANIYMNLSFAGMWLVSAGLAVYAIGIAKDDAGSESAGWIAIYCGIALTPAFYLFFYIKKIISRTIARKRDTNK